MSRPIQRACLVIVVMVSGIVTTFQVFADEPKPFEPTVKTDEVEPFQASPEEGAEPAPANPGEVDEKTAQLSRQEDALKRWKAVLGRADGLMDEAYELVEKASFEGPLSEELAHKLDILLDVLAYETAAVKQDYGKAMELASRQRIVCDLVLRLGAPNLHSRLMARARRLIAATYFDEENPAAGVLYALGMEGAAKYAAGGDQTYLGVVEYFQEALAYVGNSATWGERIQGHILLALARHREAFRGSPELKTSELLQGALEVRDAITRGLLSLEATGVAQALYGRLVHESMTILLANGKFARAVQVGNEHVAVWFPWPTKELDYLLAAQAAHSMNTRRKDELRKVHGDKAEAMIRSDPQVDFYREKVLHLARQGLELLQHRLEKGLVRLVTDELAESLAVNPVAYEVSSFDCGIIDRYIEFLQMCGEYKSKISTLNRLKGAVCETAEQDAK